MQTDTGIYVQEHLIISKHLYNEALRPFALYLRLNTYFYVSPSQSQDLPAAKEK